MVDSPAHELIAALPPFSRLALAYAPAAARPVWCSVLALDARLARVVRDAREPLIGQIRLAWWRERLAEDSSAWPAGEPLLALLREWRNEQGTLGAVVDGWEVLLGDAPLDADSLLAAADGRAAGLVAAAVQLGEAGHAQAVRALGRSWALADLAHNLTDPTERASLAELAARAPAPAQSLPRVLRPAVVLEGLSRRPRSGPAGLLHAIRLGILGR